MSGTSHIQSLVATLCQVEFRLELRVSVVNRTAELHNEPARPPIDLDPVSSARSVNAAGAGRRIDTWA